MSRTFASIDDLPAGTGNTTFYSLSKGRFRTKNSETDRLGGTLERVHIALDPGNEAYGIPPADKIEIVLNGEHGTMVIRFGTISKCASIDAAHVLRHITKGEEVAFIAQSGLKNSTFLRGFITNEDGSWKEVQKPKMPYDTARHEAALKSIRHHECFGPFEPAAKAEEAPTAPAIIQGDKKVEW